LILKLKVKIWSSFYNLHPESIYPSSYIYIERERVGRRVLEIVLLALLNENNTRDTEVCVRECITSTLRLE
jgi:hypothetical protein